MPPSSAKAPNSIAGQDKTKDKLTLTKTAADNSLFQKKTKPSLCLLFGLSLFI